MAGGVGADLQRLGDGGVRVALRQECGNFELSPGKPVSLLQVRTSPRSPAVRAVLSSLFLQLCAKLPHLAYRFEQSRQQLLAVSLEIRKFGEKIVETIVRHRIPAVWANFVPLVFLHAAPTSSNVRIMDLRGPVSLSHSNTGREMIKMPS